MLSVVVAVVFAATSVSVAVVVPAVAAVVSALPVSTLLVSASDLRTLKKSHPHHHPR